jgi:hypothetical protein
MQMNAKLGKANHNVMEASKELFLDPPFSDPIVARPSCTPIQGPFKVFLTHPPFSHFPFLSA